MKVGWRFLQDTAGALRCHLVPPASWWLLENSAMDRLGHPLGSGSAASELCLPTACRGGSHYWVRSWSPFLPSQRPLSCGPRSSALVQEGRGQADPPRGRGSDEVCVQNLPPGLPWRSLDSTGERSFCSDPRCYEGASQCTKSVQKPLTTSSGPQLVSKKC